MRKYLPWIALLSIWIGCSGDPANITVNLTLDESSVDVEDVEFYIFFVQAFSEGGDATEAARAFPGACVSDACEEEIDSADCCLTIENSDCDDFSRDGDAFEFSLAHTIFPLQGKLKIFACAMDASGTPVAGAVEEGIDNANGSKVNLTIEAPSSECGGLVPPACP